MSRALLRVIVVTLFAGSSVGVAAMSSAAGTFPAPPHSAVGGFSVNGAGFSLVYADGSVRPGPYGDAFDLHLPLRITAAAVLPGGGGYWEVAADGNVFNFGAAPALGGTGGVPLNQPVFAIAPTPTGKGYFLATRDGGVFAFGDALFHGSAASLPLKQPIMGITTSPTGHGYRLVARDGGIFSFGKIAFAGSLPGRHVHVSDVIGMAATPSGNGYWIARSNGQVAAFGDAPPLGNGTASACDRFTAIIGNPNALGYRLVKDSGRSVGFGDAPGGVAPIGPQRQCGRVTARIELASTTVGAGSSVNGDFVVDNETGHPLRILSRGCKPKWAVTIANDDVPNAPLFTTECTRKPLVIAAGESQRPFTVRASCVDSRGPCGGAARALPAGQYEAEFVPFGLGGRVPPVAPVPVTVVARS